MLNELQFHTLLIFVMFKLMTQTYSSSQIYAWNIGNVWVGGWNMGSGWWGEMVTKLRRGCGSGGFRSYSSGTTKAV